MPQTGFIVFLSHNSADKPAVEELGRRLRKEGLEPWLDKWNLIPGEAYQPAIEEALDRCECCAVFVGPSGVGPWQNEEMRAAIARRIEDRGRAFRVIPVLLPGGERGKRSNLPTFLVSTTWVEFRQTLDEAAAFHRLLCGIRGLAPGAEPNEAVFEGKCPYRGLQFFDVEHATFFQGRESLIEWLLNALSPAKKSPTRFLAILGASGSGKSSLARAGLVAHLQKDGLPGSSKWPIAICRPGPNPLESLALALAKAGIINADPSTVLQMIDSMTRSDTDTALHLAMNLALPNDAARAVVLVDQFEELFTLCANEDLRQAFLRNLLHAALAPRGRTIVALTMRADFLGQCASYAKLAAAMSDDQILVGPMTEFELRQAIERPAQLVGLELAPGLTDILVREVNEQPGALPLLQHTLLTLWERRLGRQLTTLAYQQVGGVKRAITETAESVFGDLSSQDQEELRNIFVRLTRLDEGTGDGAAIPHDARQRSAMIELNPVGGDLAQTKKLIGRLADRRLIVTRMNPATGHDEVEVAHESLIQHWPRLRQWLDEDRSGLRLRTGVTEAAKEWHAQGEDYAFLIHRGSRLDDAEALRGHPRLRLNQIELSYVDACVALRDREKTESERQQREKLEAAQAQAREAERRREAEEHARREAEQRAEQEAIVRQHIAKLGTISDWTLLAVLITVPGTMAVALMGAWETFLGVYWIAIALSVASGAVMATMVITMWIRQQNAIQRMEEKSPQQLMPAGSLFSWMELPSVAGILGASAGEMAFVWTIYANADVPPEGRATVEAFGLFMGLPSGFIGVLLGVIGMTIFKGAGERLGQRIFTAIGWIIGGATCALISMLFAYILVDMIPGLRDRFLFRRIAATLFAVAFVTASAIFIARLRKRQSAELAKNSMRHNEFRTGHDQASSVANER